MQSKKGLRHAAIASSYRHYVAAYLAGWVHRAVPADQNRLRRVGLTPEVIADPEERLSVRSQVALLDEAAIALKDDRLGFTLALDFDPRELGLLYYVTASSHTLGDALKRVARYSQITNEALVVGYREGNRINRPAGPTVPNLTTTAAGDMVAGGVGSSARQPGVIGTSQFVGVYGVETRDAPLWPLERAGLRAALKQEFAFFFSPIAGERGARRLLPHLMIGPRGSSGMLV